MKKLKLDAILQNIVWLDKELAKIQNKAIKKQYPKAFGILFELRLELHRKFKGVTK